MKSRGRPLGSKKRKSFELDGAGEYIAAPLLSPSTPGLCPPPPLPPHHRVVPRRLQFDDAKARAREDEEDCGMGLERKPIAPAAVGEELPNGLSSSRALRNLQTLENLRRRRSPRLVSLVQQKEEDPQPSSKKKIQHQEAAALDGGATAAKKRLSRTTGRTKQGTNKDGKSNNNNNNNNRAFFKRVLFQEVEYRVGDDVYVRRSSDENGQQNDDEEDQQLQDLLASDSDEEVEECQVCGEFGKEIMIECDDCLGGFHLSCLTPPLTEVPEGDWFCLNCEAIAKGEQQQVVEHQPHERKRRRTARERFLAQEIWAARIEKLWCENDGTYYFQARWWTLPEETAEGRKPWHARRELFRSNTVDENEMDTILRHCYVMSPEEYSKSSHEGDDVFLCGHEYDFRHQTFKRIANAFDHESEGDDSDDENFHPMQGPHGVVDGEEDDEDDDNDDDGLNENEEDYRGGGGMSWSRCKTNTLQKKGPPASRAANVRRGYADRIEGIGAKCIPPSRKRPLTELEKAKAALMLSATPASLPCRDKERNEIESFLKEAVAAGEHCLGRCLYISGVPGTGKTATVLEVMKGLRAKVDKNELPPYRFVEINGLRLPSPDHAYSVLHEALTGQHVGWRRALQSLDARFSETKPLKGMNARPCILLVDELDLLVTRNQSVLYNLFDWPSRPNSRLIVIGIANTMDLPERMLPRIASRLGLNRISFSPYSHTQLQQILATRLHGIAAFDKQAVEFASRKVAAVSGDARRALELCRRAVEIAEERSQPSMSNHVSMDLPWKASEREALQSSQGLLQSGSKLIGMSDVEAAISEMFQAPHIQMMKRCAKYAKILLVAMVNEQQRTTMVETSFEKVVDACIRLCATHGVPCPTADALLAIGSRLGACRILLCEAGARHRLQKLQLNFPCDDVSFALKDDKEMPWLAKHL